MLLESTLGRFESSRNSGPIGMEIRSLWKNIALQTQAIRSASESVAKCTAHSGGAGGAVYFMLLNFYNEAFPLIIRAHQVTREYWTRVQEDLHRRVSSLVDPSSRILSVVTSVRVCDRAGSVNESPLLKLDKWRSLREKLFRDNL